MECNRVERSRSVFLTLSRSSLDSVSSVVFHSISWKKELPNRTCFVSLSPSSPPPENGGFSYHCVYLEGSASVKHLETRLHACGMCINYFLEFFVDPHRYSR